MNLESPRSRRRALLALVALTVLASMGLAWPRRAPGVGQDWPAHTWFRFADGRPVTLDEPPAPATPVR